MITGKKALPFAVVYGDEKMLLQPNMANSR